MGKLKLALRHLLINLGLVIDCNVNISWSITSKCLGLANLAVAFSKAVTSCCCPTKGVSVHIFHMQCLYGAIKVLKLNTVFISVTKKGGTYDSFANG